MLTSADEGGCEGASGDGAGCCSPGGEHDGSLEEHGGCNWKWERAESWIYWSFGEWKVAKVKPARKSEAWH